MQMPTFSLTEPVMGLTHVQVASIHIENGVFITGPLGTVVDGEFVRQPMIEVQSRQLTPEQVEGFWEHIGPAFAAFATIWGDDVMYGAPVVDEPVADDGASDETV